MSNFKRVITIARESLSKDERIKSRLIIEQLFSEGISLFTFPLKLMVVRLANEESQSQPFLFSVSVPKRIHNKAANRNLLKRRVREAYRKNKPSINSTDVNFNRYALMYILVDKSITTYDVLEKSMRKLNKKLEQHINQNE